MLDSLLILNQLKPFHNKMIKIFICGRCNEDIGTRKDLRKHLKEEHVIKREIANFSDKNNNLLNQTWWKFREFK